MIASLWNLAGPDLIIILIIVGIPLAAMVGIGVLLYYFLNRKR